MIGLWLMGSLIGLSACGSTPDEFPSPPTVASTTEAATSAAAFATAIPADKGGGGAGGAHPATATPNAGTPVTNPPIQNGRTLPRASQDLLFIDQQTLKVWSHQSGKVEILLAGSASAGNVVDYAISGDGRSLLINRVHPANEQHDLLMLDLNGRQTQPIASGLTNLQSYALSPDGQQVAYAALATTEPLSPTVWLADVATGESRAVAVCVEGCYNLVWHPAGDLVVWNDRDAVWWQNLVASQPEILALNQHVAAGVTADEIHVYRPQSWSPNGRYLLVQDGRYEGFDYAVIDVPSQTVIAIPNSYVYGNTPATELTWMQDDRLYLLHDAEKQKPTAELWRVDPEVGELVLEESHILGDSQFFSSSPAHLADGRFAYALVTTSNNSTAGIYFLTAMTEQPQRINALLPVRDDFETQVLWLADGTGALIRQANSLLYASSDNQTLFNVRPLLGQSAHHFSWVTTP